MLNGGSTCRIDCLSEKNAKDTNYEEHKDMLKLFNKYSKASFNVLNKEGFH